MEGFVAKQEMPTYLSLLFRARRPLDPLRAPHIPVYANRPIEPLIDSHHAGASNGLLGNVSKEAGEGWLRAIFEEPSQKEEGDREGDLAETKEQSCKRVQKLKIK